MWNYVIKDLLKKDYLDSYEKLYLEDKSELLFAVWRDLIIPNTSYKFSQLSEDKQDVLSKSLESCQIKINTNLAIGKLDSQVVFLLLDTAVKLKKTSIVNFVYKRTKSAAITMPQYFYFNKLITCYLNLLEIDNAKEMLNYVYNLNHRSYWNKINNTNIDNFSSYPEFLKELRKLKIKSIVNLVKSGEVVNVDLDLNLLNELNQYK